MHKTYFSSTAGWNRMCNGHCTSYCSLTQSQPDITTPGWSAKIKQRNSRKKLFSLEWENQISGLPQIEDLHLRQSNFTACSKYKVRKLGYEKKQVEQEKTNFMVKCSTQRAADWDPILMTQVIGYFRYITRLLVPCTVLRSILTTILTNYLIK